MRQTQCFLNLTISELFDKYVFKILASLMLVFMLLGSNLAFAESAPICPSGHAMYYLGAKNLGTTPEDKLTLSWSGNTSNYSTTYTFKNNTTIKLSFSDINYLRDGYPEASIFAGVTTNAINMRHSSQQIAINHRLTALINKPVSKYGFVVQDLDSNASGRYTESMSIVTAGGSFSNYNTNFTLTNLNKTITGNQWPNCNPSSPCNFNIEWEAKSANTPFVATHGNPYSGASTTTSTGDHAVGYSDFYFCLAPPKLIVKKALSSTRVNTNDQFEIAVSGGALAANSFTTTGTGSTITNGTSATFTLADSTSYTITERVMNGTTLGDIANYNATYVCSNATTGSTTVMPTAAMTYNATAKTRSFTLANATFGDEITCTITNTPGNYTFTGFVFNDNGGIARSTNPDTKSDISTTFTGNSKYFNGIFDNGETGIGSTIGLTISLTNCDGVNIGGTTSQTNSDNPLGQYKFTVPVNVIAALSPQKVCIVQAEPDPWVFSVDTTPNIRNIDLQAGKLDYKTEGSLNLDFGEVEGDYAALVLRKAQYVNDCRSTLNYTATNINTAGNTDPRSGFSESGISGSDLTPGQCIAYRITATNRANLTINNFVMRDVLQKKGENNALVTSVLIGVSNASDYANDNVPIGKNGTVKTTEFVLNPKTFRNFYFNTKYGTTVDVQ
ncbi:hypothetical protein [Psychrobacter sp. 4Bb]|uniref:hypothetical protein n=1 Tax=Psychrobacter sp. 4Bb TaxID=888436 RepID=UPI000C7DCD68|nr:hypothetical protein [Psychrobacter sp. 4Bb]PKH81560.1 hypothetical protein CXF60_04210 [Psychrobacter sp. 4Bb]